MMGHGSTPREEAATLRIAATPSRRRMTVYASPRCLLLSLLLLLLEPCTAQNVAVLPNPPVPANATARTGCPHTAPGLKRWNNATTWGGAGIPTANASVVIPANTKVLITQTIPFTLGKITIPVGSELIIGENTSGIKLTTTGIDVQGRLTVGSSTCRVIRKVTITLVGSRPANAVTSPPEITYKGISVTGTLNLHGERFYQTWSRLASTAYPGNRTLALKRPVNWKKGQKIVLVTSSMHDARSLHQNEELTVVNVTTTNLPAGTGAIVRVQEPIAYQHTANAYYQVEAGLLTRTILVQGSSADSEPSDPDPKTCRFTPFNQWHFSWNLSQACTDKETTGFGGHIVVHSGGKGFVQGVELYRMGQTNVLGRYPIHFHLLGDSCPTCFFKDSSVHRSYYRCISVHGTNNMTVSENVAYDIIGYCYYLEDGVEQYNTLSYNLVAHVHTLGPDIPTGWAQTTNVYNQTSTLTLPADVTASGFYITNVRNYIMGNAASGGWAGFAFPSLATALGPHKTLVFRPSNEISLTLDGNTAHSTGMWWDHAGAFYFGGSLYYPDGGSMLQYNPGRSFNFWRDDRRPCSVNNCAAPYNDCAYGCPESKESWVRMTNSKAFLTAGVGVNSWSGRMELINFEAHDARLSVEALSPGFWIDKMLAVCRTGESLGLPAGTKASRLEGSGFYWYDTGQSHIITNTEFRNCGLRSSSYSQYDSSPSRGCADNDDVKGCSGGSTVFGFLTHSDEFTPEVMQGTKAIKFTSCGRRFKYTTSTNTVSARGQNWLDADGTISGFGAPTLIGSGLETASSWWRVDDQVVLDPQAPLSFIKQNLGPERQIGHIRLSWDTSLHDQVGSVYCGNGNGLPCPTLGYIRHLGYKFSPARNASLVPGLPVTANPDIVGPVGGFGWLLKLDAGAPRDLNITQVEQSPNSTMLLSIAYPPGTTVTIKATAAWCWAQSGVYTCEEVYRAVTSVAEVRSSTGNAYYMSPDGVLTVRIVEFARLYTGNPNWFLPSYSTPARNDPGGFAIAKFQRGGVLLPNDVYANNIRIVANCAGTGPYCSGTVGSYDPDVCQAGYKQTAYDTCCSGTNPNVCTFANGSTKSRRLRADG